MVRSIQMHNHEKRTSRWPHPTECLLALDQGTTSCRAVLFGRDGSLLGTAQREFSQYFPRPGWVEHDPRDILETQRRVVDEVLADAAVSPARVAAAGITNQRETTVVWDRHSGEPIHPAIVWQDRRTAPLCESLRQQGLEPHIREITGLLPDAYFSATKISWILDNVPNARVRARNGDLLFGTVDTWLIWNLTGGRFHATDPSNASRTMLYDIRRGRWDPVLLDALAIPESMLPEVRDSADEFGALEAGGGSIAIRGVAGDQQAALFGQACLAPGDAKNTYGTGCFLLMNTGTNPVPSSSGLLTTIAWRLAGRTVYALEGSIFVAGAAIQWLRDELGILDTAAQSEALAAVAGRDDDVVVVPAFTGLGAPHWDMYARGAIFGLTRDTSREQIVRATLDALACQTRDVLHAMQADAGIEMTVLRADGGAAANNFLMQTQADILNVSVERPRVLESTALGAAALAAVGAGLLPLESAAAFRKPERIFTPSLPGEAREAILRRWDRAVARCRAWVESGDRP